jgi:hypothetical protein
MKEKSSYKLFKLSERFLSTPPLPARLLYPRVRKISTGFGKPPNQKEVGQGFPGKTKWTRD